MARRAQHCFVLRSAPAAPWDALRHIDFANNDILTHYGLMLHLFSCHTQIRVVQQRALLRHSLSATHWGAPATLGMPHRRFMILAAWNAGVHRLLCEMVAWFQD